ncbi:MAG: SDR family oxidoreductase [Rhizobium sp.]|uniref:SDR family oxidoreductase n=1 Tax=Rhizobium sp. TaxID=391 RepID=UPI0030EFC861
MKIAVIGASGLMGTKIASVLEREGIDVVKASTSNGIDAYTGEGLERALAGADALIDVTNSGSFGESDAFDFFRKAGANMLAAARTSGVSHYLALSVVGTHRLVENDYFRAKLVQENLVRASGLSFTIVRSTQFFEFFDGIVNASAVDGVLRMASILVQPIAADEAATSIARLAAGKPANAIVEIAGPERLHLPELARELVTATDDPRPVELDHEVRYFGVSLPKDGLLPTSAAALGDLTFHDWLSRNMVSQEYA